MSFVSPQFLIFFVIIVTLYFVIPYRRRWVFLLIASYVFYGNWNANYVLLIAFTTAVSYGAARWMGRAQNQSSRKIALILSLIANLSVLFIFKYFNFFNESAAVIFQGFNLDYGISSLEFLLPVGISFYTFQAMAYTIDVYRGDMQPERNPGIYALYIAFFPQLVAGPIERARNMLPQFRQSFNFDEARVVAGLRLILWGVFKKVVIADRLAIYVNEVYSDVDEYSGVVLLIATLFFAIQIYCDFSGYSDIAIGAAQVMGFRLMQNFRQPYLSRSVREFWRRWHISLSTWFRDYVYISLGGNRVSFGRMLVNLLIVFLVSGLWHGAAWTFVIWGALHGGYVVAEVLFSRLKNPPNIPGFIRLIVTFALVCFAWIFFRASSFDDALYVVANLFNFADGLEDFARPFNAGLFPAQWEFTISVALIAILLLTDWLDAKWNFIESLGQIPAVARWTIYYVLAFGISVSLWIYVSGTADFIYFQF
jgi:D-alanyl-lipoteichoic acid acyltransferase DltB (MBOAT superfamily)